MLYTDGKYLLADCAEELTEIAQNLNIVQHLRLTTSFPCYKLDEEAQQKVLTLGLKVTTVYEMFDAYYWQNKLHVFDGEFTNE